MASLLVLKLLYYRNAVKMYKNQIKKIKKHKIHMQI